MATFSVSVGGTTVDFDMADVDAQRIITAYALMGATREERGGVISPPKSEQVIRNIATAAVNFLTQTTQSFEKGQAARNAAAAVKPLPASINVV